MFTEDHIAEANRWCRGTLQEALGITFHAGGPDELVATMPVGPATVQPMGLLHGGATAALAESLGSTGSAMLVDLSTQAVVGIEVNANHLKGVRSGMVTATGRLVHRGRSTHVWDIRVTDGEGALVAVCRMTNMILVRS